MLIVKKTSKERVIFYISLIIVMSGGMGILMRKNYLLMHGTGQQSEIFFDNQGAVPIETSQPSDKIQPTSIDQEVEAKIRRIINLDFFTDVRYRALISSKKQGDNVDSVEGGNKEIFR